MFARGVPSICYGLRGLVYFQIDFAAAAPTCIRSLAALS
jgi:hypothetical protein